MPSLHQPSLVLPADVKPIFKKSKWKKKVMSGTPGPANAIIEMQWENLRKFLTAAGRCVPTEQTWEARMACQVVELDCLRQHRHSQKFSSFQSGIALILHLASSFTNTCGLTISKMLWLFPGNKTKWPWFRSESPYFIARVCSRSSRKDIVCRRLRNGPLIKDIPGNLQLGLAFDSYFSWTKNIKASAKCTSSEDCIIKRA